MAKAFGTRAFLPARPRIPRQLGDSSRQRYAHQRAFLSSRKIEQSSHSAASTPPQAPPIEKLHQRVSKHPSRLRQLWNDGSILLFLGWSGLTLLVLDRFLQYQSAQDAADMVGIIQDETRQKRRELLEKYKNAPTLFECVIRTEYKMGGSHGLKGAKVNDIVQVLEEAVGPGKYYNLCRIEIDGEVSVGWYPESFMEKVTPRRKAGRWLPW